MTRLFFIFSTFAIAAASVASPIDFPGSAKTASQTPGLGACGDVISGTEFGTGVNAAFFDSFPGYEGLNPNKNPLCGRLIQVRATDNGHIVQVKVTDRFTEGNMYDLMLSQAAFAELTDEPGSSIPVKWTLVVDPPSNI